MNIRFSLFGIIVMLFAGLVMSSCNSRTSDGYVYIGELKEHTMGNPMAFDIQKDLHGMVPSPASPLKLSIVLQNVKCEAEISVFPLPKPDVTSLTGRIERLHGVGCQRGYSHGFVVGDYDYVDNHIVVKPYFIVTTIKDQLFDDIRFKLNK